MLPLATNARAKMQGLRQGFVKLIVLPRTGIVVGGVVVAPAASELILPIALAVQNGLSAKDLAYTFSVYPSLSGSITEVGPAAHARHGPVTGRPQSDSTTAPSAGCGRGGSVVPERISSRPTRPSRRSW